ncbi:MAG: nitrilase-related carbon-nitrogen hydrolase [Mycobacteriales bacterium]|nr:MAG: carbon-nitrogen hydrolase [Pseudonocardiales bacterium]
MRLALVQLGGQSLPDPDARRVAAAAVLADVPPVDLIVLPELWPVGFFHFDDYDRFAEPLDGPTARFAADLAAARSCWVHGGSFVEQASALLHNTSVLVDPTGTPRLHYRKVHLFGYQSREQALLHPGRTASVTDGPGGLRAGAATCYDLRFPEIFRAMQDDGAQCFLVTSAWPAARLEHWRILCRARALENLAFLIACNAVGDDNGVTLGGHSMVVDPLGEIVAEAGDGEQTLVVDIEPERVDAVRAEFPFLTDRADNVVPADLTRP